VTVLRGGGATDAGLVRPSNQDALLVSDELFAVADGVGGHQAGEVASQAAVDALRESFTDRSLAGLITAVTQANQVVWERSQSDPDLQGMGTTMTALALVQEDGEDRLALVNVGDSRAYLFQHGELSQLTEDHSYVEALYREGVLTREQADVHPLRSRILRAIGSEPDVEVDGWQVAPNGGDRVVLCSDGLTNELGDEDIVPVLAGHDDPTETAETLVRLAREHGGRDNVTVVVVDVVDD
jgi:PPM family protein phosphatase